MTSEDEKVAIRTRHMSAFSYATRARAEGMTLEQIARLLGARKCRIGMSEHGWTAEDVERILKM